MPTERKKFYLIIFFVAFAFTSVLVGSTLTNRSLDMRNQAAAPSSQVIQYKNVANLFSEEKTIAYSSQPQSIVVTPIIQQTKKANSLPTTGTWKGKTVKVVPNDRFFPQYNYFTYYGIRSLEGLRDGRVMGGGLHAFFIHNPTDVNWSNLQLVEVPQSFDLYGNVTLQFVETNQSLSDIYLMGLNGVLLFQSNGSLSEVKDPFSTMGHLDDLKDMVPYGDKGAVAVKEGPYSSGQALYYIEGNKVRKWLLPRPDPNKPADGISGIFLDTTAPDNKTLYTIVGCSVYGGLCPASEQWMFYLYQLKFSSDPNVPLEAIRLSKLTTSGNTNGAYYLHIQVKNRADDPSKKIVYGDSGNLSTSQNVMAIADFNPSYPTMNIARQAISANGAYRDFIVETDSKDNVLWLSGDGNIFRATGLGLSDSPLIESMTTEESYKILANPYTESITTDSLKNILVGHQPLSGQFNNASLTLFETGQTPSPTVTPSINPTKTPTPTRTPTPSPTPILGLINGGFEIDEKPNNNMPDGWNAKKLTSKDVLITSRKDAHRGQRFFKMTAKKPAGNTKILEQPIANYLPKNTTFTLTGWNKLTSNLSNGSITVSVTAVVDGVKKGYRVVFDKTHHGWQKK